MRPAWSRGIAIDRALEAAGASSYRYSREPGLRFDPDRVYTPDQIADIAERWQAESKLRVVRQCQQDGGFQTPADQAHWLGFSQQLHGPNWVELSQALEWH